MTGWDLLIGAGLVLLVVGLCYLQPPPELPDLHAPPRHRRRRPWWRRFLFPHS